MSARAPLRCRDPGCPAVLGWVQDGRVEVAPGVAVVANLTTGTADLRCPRCGSHRRFYGKRLSLALARPADRAATGPTAP